MDMDMDMGMVTMDIMARGPLRLNQDMDIMVMDMAMVIMDIMARDLLMLSQLLLLSPDMAMDISAMDMEAMDTMDIMVRGLLMLSLDMDIMDMDMDTTVRQKPECCYFLEFSTPEVDHNRSSQN